MSQIQRPVRFVEHPARRAPTVSWKEWLKHKAELCRLYQHMTLEELVEHMKEEYGFEASCVLFGPDQADKLTRAAFDNIHTNSPNGI